MDGVNYLNFLMAGIIVQTVAFGSTTTATITCALMLGLPAGDHVRMAVIWSIGILIIAVPLSLYLFRRHTSH